MSYVAYIHLALTLLYLYVLYRSISTTKYPGVFRYLQFLWQKMKEVFCLISRRRLKESLNSCYVTQTLFMEAAMLSVAYSRNN